MKLRRFAITFLLLLNSAALVLAILTFSNGSPLSDVTDVPVEDASDLLVLAQSDASIATFLAILGIGANLVLGYLFLGRPDERETHRGDLPRITGE